MQLIFVRHGPKERLDGVLDAELPLTMAAADLAAKLRAALEARELSPRYILSSRYRHAMETAEFLRAKRTRAVIPVTALTPHTAEEDFSMATIASEAWSVGADFFDDAGAVLLVGHESRLSQLASRLLGKASVSQLEPLEARIVELSAVEQARFKG